METLSCRNHRIPKPAATNWPQNQRIPNPANLSSPSTDSKFPSIRPSPPAPTSSMAPPSSFSSQFDDPAARRPPQQRKPPLLMLLPLIYAPVLPLRSANIEDRLFYGVLVGAFAHGTYLISELYDVESK